MNRTKKQRDAVSWVLINGQWHKAPAKVDIQNRAFLYGDALFETMRTYTTKVLFLDRHVTRLHSAMKMLQIPVPEQLEAVKIADNAAKLLHRNKWYTGARLRLTVFRQAEGKYTPVNDQCGYVLSGEALQSKPLYPFSHRGKIVTCYTRHKKYNSPLAVIKSTNSLMYTLAGIYARDNGFDDSLIMNTDNEIIEAVSANLLVVEGNNMIAPGPEQGALDGTMRRTVLELAGQQGLKIAERGVTEDDLLRADEIMLTNAIQGIVPVKGYKERRYYTDKGAMLSEKLNKLTNNLLDA